MNLVQPSADTCLFKTFKHSLGAKEESGSSVLNGNSLSKRGEKGMQLQ